MTEVQPADFVPDAAERLDARPQRRARAAAAEARRLTGGAAYECRLVADAAGLHALARPWSELYAAAGAAYLNDGFDWCRLCWDLIAAPRGHELCCVTVWRGPQLVAIWPLVVAQRRHARIASPLTSETSEYPPFLIRPDAEPEQVADAALACLRGAGRVDAVYLPLVRRDGPLGRGLGARRDVVRIFSRPTFALRRGDFPDWPAYADQLPHRVRAQLARDRRRAAKLGALAFESVTDPQERQAVWRWMLARKREQLARRGVENPWINTAAYARFISSTLEAFGPERRPIFALKLDGRVIAADLCSVDRRRVEQFVTTFDEDYARIGPGNLLREESTRWAFARGLDYDWRSGEEPHKPQWASQQDQVDFYALPLRPRGWLWGGYVWTRRRLGGRLPPAWRARLARLRGRRG